MCVCVCVLGMTQGRDQKCVQNSSQKTSRERQNGRPMYRRNYNTKMDLKEVGFEDVDRIQLAHHRNQRLCSLQLVKRRLPTLLSPKRLFPVARTSWLLVLIHRSFNNDTSTAEDD
jgi:hypothetical protein